MRKLYSVRGRSGVELYWSFRRRSALLRFLKLADTNFVILTRSKGGTIVRLATS